MAAYARLSHRTLIFGTLFTLVTRVRRMIIGLNMGRAERDVVGAFRAPLLGIYEDGTKLNPSTSATHQIV